MTDLSLDHRISKLEKEAGLPMRGALGTLERLETDQKSKKSEPEQDNDSLWFTEEIG